MFVLLQDTKNEDGDKKIYIKDNQLLSFWFALGVFFFYKFVVVFLPIYSKE